jgi:hypothetical protein
LKAFISDHLSFSYLPLNPSLNQHHNKINLSLTQRPTFLESMPFLYTFPTTGGVSVLSDEYGILFHGVCLPSFFGNAGATLVFIN